MFVSRRFANQESIPAELQDDTLTEVGDEGQKYNPKIMTYIKEDWIKRQIKSR
jgi:hypothetical protein